MTAHLLRLALCAAVAAGALGTDLAGPSAAQSAKKGTTVSSPHAPLIHGLHQTHALLQQANHDYDHDNKEHNHHDVEVQGQ